MFGKRNRKRKLGSDHSASQHGHRLRRSQRIKAFGNDRHEAQPLALHSQSSSPPQPPQPPQPHNASSHGSHGLKSIRPQNNENERHTIPPTFEDEQRKEFTFFSFPGELRNMIYNYSLHYPDSRKLYAPYYRRHAITKASPPWEPRFRAPTILLLNKRITNECLLILKSTTLVVDRLPPHRTVPDSDKYGCPYECYSAYPLLNHFMRLSDFITPRTLQSIPQIDINVGLCEGPMGSGWAWVPVVDELIQILTRKNACVKLRLLIRLCNPHDYPAVALPEREFQNHLMRRLRKFADINPNVFARCEIKVEVWKIEGHKATCISARNFPEPVLVLEDGEVYNLVRPEKTLPASRMYPDKEMFPGSVMEFVKPAPPPYYSSDDSD